MRRVLLLGVLALLIAGCGSADASLPNVEVRPFKSDPAASVSLASIHGGDVTVALSATGLKVVPPADATNLHLYGEGHYHLFVDVPPTPGGEAIPKGVGGIYHVSGSTFTIHNLGSGRHKLYVLLGFSDHLPYEASAGIGGKFHGAIAELDFTVGPGQTAITPEASPSPAPTTAAPASPSAAASAPAAAAAARIQVVADQTNGGAYNPGSAKAKVGDTVQWSWTDDSAQHSVTSDDGKFDSGLQGKGSTFDQKFTSAGTYKYHCSVHPQMLGQITVQ